MTSIPRKLATVMIIVECKNTTAWIVTYVVAVPLGDRYAVGK